MSISSQWGLNNAPPIPVLALPFLTASAAAQQPDQLKGLHWRSVGPANNAGRVSVVAGVPGNRDVYYVAGANGGIIKTTNGGITFKPIFDKQSVASIGAIAIAPSDPNIIYVGTGEENPRNNASIGDGMYKSVDAGEHWTHIGLAQSDKIARIVIDAKNPDLVYACGLGREWGPNEERGVFKTMDGGKTWRKVLYVDPQTACSDIAADPGNSNILYAGMYTYRRWAWHLESGGGNTAVYRSVNGGDTWERLSGKDQERGLPKTDMDRIGIAVAPSDPSIVYVISETKTEGELWRSDDGGDHWRTVNRDPNINFRPFYYADIRVDPQNPNRVFSLSGSLYLSEDGGQNFRTIARDVHGDHQALWIDPTNPKYILSGSDGGWQVSYDGSKNFEVVNTFPFTQFYHINYDMQRPYMVCGGLQDNGNWCGPSQALSGQGVRKNDWYTVSGGDGFFTVPVMDKPWLVYSDAQGGMLNITDTRTGTQKTIYPYPNRVGSVGDAMISHKYRFNWNSPIALSPLNPKVVYFGGNVLFKSTDYGMSWQVISPDLTTNDPKKQESSGGPIVVDNTAAEFHCTILTIAPSPIDSNVIWVGTDDGNVQVTRDGGKTWSNVFTNVPGLKPNAWIPDGRRVALRRGHRVRRRGSSSGRRLRAARVHDDGLRQDLEADHRRSPGVGRVDARRARRSAQSQPALHRHGDGRVGVVGPRHPLGFDARRSPRRSGARHPGASARERPPARHARSRPLHHGRHLGAAEPGGRADGRRHVVRHSAGDAVGPVEPRRKSRPEEVDGRKPARGRAHHVLPQVAAARRGEHHDHGQGRPHGATHASRVGRRGRESRRVGSSHATPRRERPLADVADAAVAAPARRRRPMPIRLSPPSARVARRRRANPIRAAAKKGSAAAAAVDWM